MKFDDNKAIYLQISDLICENILEGKWNEGYRIPSVRDMAVSLEVNPNTVSRTYALLESKNAIENKRGIGCFVSERSKESIKKFMKEEFITNELPGLIKKIKILEIKADELAGLIEAINEH